MVAGNRRLAGKSGEFRLRPQVVSFVLFVAFVMCGSAVRLLAQNSPTEYEVKAAYLYQFGKFVEWPEGALDRAGDVFTICILGADPFGAVLDELISGRTVQGKRPVAKHLANSLDASDCNIVFISPSEQKHMAEILKTVRGKSILTVGDRGDFISQGGMIQFVIEQNKVRFEINLSAVERANLKVSSQLLKVAKVTRD